MKRFVFSMAVALIMGTAACMAQEERGSRPDPSKRMERMITDLGLNESQAAQFKSLMEEMRPGKGSTDERPSREEMQKKRTDMETKIKAILTDEQYKKYQSMRPEGRGRGGRR